MSWSLQGLEPGQLWWFGSYRLRALVSVTARVGAVGNQVLDLTYVTPSRDGCTRFGTSVDGTWRDGMHFAPPVRLDPGAPATCPWED